MKTILFLENENPHKDSSGGIMTYLINLSKFLRSQNYNTILCGTGKLSKKKSSFSSFINISKKDSCSNFRYILSLFLKINFLKLNSSSIIHAQRPDMLVPAIIFKSKCKLICSLHGAHDIAVYDKKGKIAGFIYSFLQKFSFKHTDSLIAVDQSTADYYKTKYPFIKKKIKVIPIAVDVDLFFPMIKKDVRAKNKLCLNGKIIIFVGRLEKEKNIKLLIDSFNIASKKIKNLNLLIVGTGKDETTLKKYVESNMIKNIIFRGEVSNTQIPELINCADLLALTSYYEGSPNVVKESIACNIPIVSVDVGDVKSVIENLDKCYIANYDKNNFSEKLLKVLHDDKKIDIYLEAKKYTKEYLGQATMDYYEANLRNE